MEVYIYGMKQAPFLNPGDTIGIVCPAGYMPTEKATECINTLKKWGYKVVKGKTLGGKSKNYFSGTDEERLNDLQLMLDNEKINAILFGRGGYGTTRILDKINWKKFKKNPKWIIGFSDITVLHGYMHEQLGFSSIHGPMAGAFNKGENRFTLSLKDTLENKPVLYLSKPHAYNKVGKAKAQVVGGNLCLLCHCIGSNAEIDTDGKILFIEDIGEQLYNIDRLMMQLKRAGKLKKLKGLIVGGFTDSMDTDRPFGKTAYEIIADAVKEYKYPTCFGFPIGHWQENVAIIVGQKYKLSITADQVSLASN
jgi:muramoyltetrapeptide carboxypeptidase